MKKIFTIISLVMLVFTFTSCEDKNQQQDTLSLSPNDPIQFEAMGGVKTITVTTNFATWDVASSQEWCKVAKAADGKSFTVTAENYAEKDPRPTAEVTVTAKNGNVTKTTQLTASQVGTTIDPFTIAISKVTVNGADMEVKALDQNATYYYDVLPKKVLQDNHSNSLATYIDNMIKQAVEFNEGDLQKALEAVVTIGDDKYTFKALMPNTEYIALAVGIDAQGKPSTRFVQKEFKTLDNSVAMTFAIDVTAKYYNGFDYKINPSTDQHSFYTTIRHAGKYENMTDAELRDRIISEDSFMIDFMLQTGQYSYENEEMWGTGTTYIAIAFGWADGAPTTPLTRFKITTEAVDIPVGSSFSFVTSGITARSAEVVVTPTVDKAMYVWDLIDQATYSQYENDLGAYVGQYISEIYADIDNNLVRGENTITFGRRLTPDTKYYVWAAYVDQFGVIVGDVKLSTQFSTMPNVQSDAKVTSSIEKYFNGDDLFAKDPIKYANAKGNAYVPITYSANEKSLVWYAVMVVEEPNNPTSAISDAEMAFALENGAGKWCNVSEIYYCDWDNAHTALGVSINKTDENYGPVMRDSYTFTKAGAAPISEFVEPQRAPAANKVAVHKTQTKIKTYKTTKANKAK